MKRCIPLCLLILATNVTAAEEPAPTGRPFLTIETGGHRGRITQVLFSRDSKRLISVSLDKTIRIWDVMNRERPRVLRPPIGDGSAGELHAAALSADGKTLAAAGVRSSKQNTPIFLISVESGEIIRVLRHHGTSPIHALAFARVGNRLAAGGHNGIITLWDPDSGKQVGKLNGHSGGTDARPSAPDGKRLASVGKDKVGRIWSVEAGKVHAELKLPEAEVRYAVDWSPDGKFVATGATNGGTFGRFFALWDADGKLRKKVWHDGARLMGTLSIRFSPNSKRVFESCADEWYALTTVFDVVTGKIIRQVISENRQTDEVASGPIAHSPDGQLIAVADDRHHAIYLKRWGDKAMRKLGDRGRQITGVGWVNDKEPGRPAIVWRSHLLEKGFNYWDPIPKNFFQRCFRLADLKLTRVPEGPFAWHRLHMEGVHLSSWGKIFKIRTDKQKGKVLEVSGPGSSEAWLQGYTLITPQRVAALWQDSGYVYDAKTGKRLHRLEGSNGVLRAAATSPGKNRLLLAGGDDQVLRIWNPEEKFPILSVFVLGADWVAWTPKGYYAATPGGERLMGWHVNNGPNRMGTYYPAERFRKRLYNPDLIKQIIATGNVELAFKATSVKQRGVEEMLPPKVDFRVEQDKKNPAKVVVHVTAKSRAANQPVEMLRLLVDGRPLPDKKGVSELPKALKEARVKWTIPDLPGGRLELKVLARCEDVSGVSAAKVVIVPSAEKNRPALHVLTVGLNYAGKPGLKLGCALNDARAVSTAFGDACTGKDNLFRQDAAARELLEKEATTKGVLSALADLRKKKLKPQDLVVFFFAGHGVRQGREFYLLTHDADLKDLEKTALSGRQLRAAFSDMPCQVLLLLDACHSGAAAKGLLGFQSATDAASRHLADEECGVTLLAAAMGYEKAEEKNGNGLFTQGLLKALGKAKSLPHNHRDGRQYVHHLYNHVFDEVKYLSDDRQHPFLSLPWTTESFAIRQLTTVVDSTP